MQDNKFQQLMNNTKWNEIRKAMIEYDGTTHWRTKDIEKGFVSDWDGDWFYHFKTNGTSEDYKYIEWLEIKVPSLKMKNDVLNIFKNINVPGEIFEDVIRVYGYCQLGKFIQYL
ncbi:hypothetical protein LC087_17765 [Bacillus carboniphilus]|uniref:Uncharacterized protein n=1 Tax=Bacillus carboniphilus TaxID=86663 RepID=A0ABY9JSZ0_9BACI|nr:DUF6678 family protein [Bacillus carboniphilus]WLR42514.1 hypothetical protein LC087_17765 [Bacillus carboniphilus]